MPVDIVLKRSEIIEGFQFYFKKHAEARMRQLIETEFIPRLNAELLKVALECCESIDVSACTDSANSLIISLGGVKLSRI